MSWALVLSLATPAFDLCFCHDAAAAEAPCCPDSEPDFEASAPEPTVDPPRLMESDPCCCSVGDAGESGPVLAVPSGETTPSRLLVDGSPPAEATFAGPDRWPESRGPPPWHPDPRPPPHLVHHQTTVLLI